MSEPFDDPAFREEFRRSSERVDRRTLLSLQAIWDAMPWSMIITLPGGEEATLEKFVEPRINEATGEIEFGFDVRETLGSWHLEFFVRKTGWGAAPSQKLEIKP